MKRRRTTLVYFAAALALFWGALLATSWWPKSSQQERLYQLPAAEAAAVRRVVVEQAVAPRNSWQPSVSVTLSDSAKTISVTANEWTGDDARVALRVDGDTLVVRELAPRSPQTSRAAARYRFNSMDLKLKLPLHVTSVRAFKLDAQIDDTAQPLPRLTLDGHGVEFCCGAVQALQITSFAPPLCAEATQAATAREYGASAPVSGARSEASGEVTVNAKQVQNLRIESAGGRVIVRKSIGLRSFELLTSADTSLTVDRVDLLERLQRQPMPATREAELRAVPPDAYRCLSEREQSDDSSGP